MKRRLPERSLAFAVVVLMVEGSACSEQPTSPTLAPLDDPVNVVLISIDTLRPDHLGCYGYDDDTSPSLDEFCREAVVFENAVAHSSSTLVSHASIFSSLLPQQHGARYAERQALPDELTTLTEIFQQRGYATVSYNGGGQLSAPFGVSQGFDVYESIRDNDRFDHTVDSAIETLDSLGGKPFFLFLHTFEVHHPYIAEAHEVDRFDVDYAGPLPDQIKVNLLKQINNGEREIDDADLAHIRNVYNAEIRSMDGAFDRLVRYLRSKGLYERTMIVLTSDHGEEFGEHGMVGWHAHSLYDELLRVPLIIRFPAGWSAGTRVAGQVRGIDVAPTVLAAAGFPIPENYLGVDLGAVMRGETLAPLYAVSKQDTLAHIDNASIRMGKWKLYEDKLFDLEADPNEKVDVSADHPDVRAFLEQKMDELIASRPSHIGCDAILDDSTLQRLEALGYINRQHPAWKKSP